MSCTRLPLTAFKCFVEFTIHELSAPGVRLANKGDLYLNVCLLGQQRRTRIVQPVFPLKFGDHLMFEKTFKFCHDPSDVYNFLGDSHVLVELIQLGRADKNEVLAWFETNAKDFLYHSTSDFKSNYHSPQRDVFMVRGEGFPGSINPQIIFSTSTRINETQTPSLDILREYENRFVNDPLMDISNRQSKKRASKRRKNHGHGILRNKNSELNNPDFANHTISSAIKADYTLPSVKFKLDELNSSVKKTRIIKQAPSLKTDRPGTPNSNRTAHHQRPFVVRKVEDKLIERKPELHDMLHDGLILTEKSRKRMRRNNKRNKRRSNSLSRLPDSSHFSDMERPRSHSPNTMSRSLAPQYENNSALYHAIQTHNNKTHNQLHYSNSPTNPSSQFYDTRNRLSRSVSPFKLGISLNKNLARQNYRSPRVHSNSNGASHSRSRSVSSASRKFDLTYDVLPPENDNDESQSNCEVCIDHHSRRQSPSLLHKSQYSKNSSNSSAVFNKKKSSTRRKRDPLNETQLLKSEDLARHKFAENYGPSSFNEAHEMSNKIAQMKNHKHAYPKNQSFSHYAPPCYDVDWRYSRYYPWLFNYTEYLRELEDELHWLKVRSKHLNVHH